MTRSRSLGYLLGAALVLGVPALTRAAEPAPDHQDRGEAAWGEPRAAALPSRVSRREDVSDGVYGRFDGAFDLGLGLGAEVGEAVLPAARLSLHYFSTAGLYAGYRDAFGASAGGVERSASLGVNVRPLFVPRWSEGLERGPAILDLSLDSLALGLGAFAAQPEGRALGSSRGLELTLGGGLPLSRNARGFWLEALGVLRWTGERGDELQETSGAALLAVSWHSVFGTPIGSR